jgi:hypothetical protein
MPHDVSRANDERYAQLPLFPNPADYSRMKCLTTPPLTPPPKVYLPLFFGATWYQDYKNEITPEMKKFPKFRV